MPKFINGYTNYEDWKVHGNNKQYDLRMEVIERCQSLENLAFSDELALVQAVKVSEMSGKLAGFWSVSTSVLMNPICQARARDPESICSKCYAAATASRYAGLADALETNYKILNEFLIAESAWKTLIWPSTNGLARIESFGDVATVTCARNYIRIIRSHPWLTFGVWTKNPGIWKAAFKAEGGMPENMVWILSSDKIGIPQEFRPETIAMAHHRFTVYAENADINCGGRNCDGCRLCYSRDTEREIREKLK